MVRDYGVGNTVYPLWRHPRPRQRSGGQHGTEPPSASCTIQGIQSLPCPSFSATLFGGGPPGGCAIGGDDGKWPPPIRLTASHPRLPSCPHGSRIRCRSGCGVRDRMGFAGGVRSCTALGRSGQGELAKASWESASSGRTGVRPPRMRLLCEKHGGSVRAAPVTKTRDLGPFRGVR